MKKRLLLPLAALTAVCTPVFAQSDMDNDNGIVTVIVGDSNTAEDVEIEFKANAPKRRNDNGLPRFAIVGKDHKFYLGIGAQFLGEAVFDFGDEMPSSFAFVPSSITPRTPGNGAQLRFTAMTSSFYINAVALPGTKDRVGLFFKAAINNGNNYGFSIDNFYATYRGFLIGYGSSISPFTDGAAMPYTIDDQGPNGSANLTLFAANYTHNFTKSLSASIGIDAPTADIDPGRGVSNVNQRIPAVPLYLQYGWGKQSHLRLSGLFRPIQYRNTVSGNNHTPLGVGVQLSGLAEINPILTVYYDATYGRGIANYLQDDNGMNLDASPMDDGSGDCKLMKSMGLTAGMTLNLSSKLAFNAVYSHVTNWTGEGASLKGDQYRYGDYLATNLIYTVNKIVAFGVEYDYGHSKLFNDESLHTNRLQAQLAVTF